MTEKQWNSLKDGDEVVSVARLGDIQRMQVIAFDYYGSGKEPCFACDGWLYPRDAFNREDWLLIIDGVIQND